MPCFSGCLGNFVKKSPAKPVNILLQVIHVSVYRFRLRYLKHLPAKIQPGTHIFLADRGTGDDAAPLWMPGNPVPHGLLITLQKGFLGRVELIADDGQFPHDVVNARIRYCPSAEKTDSAPLQHTHGPRLQCGEAAQVFRVADTLAAKRGQVFGRKLRAAQVKRNQFLSGCPDVDIEIDHKQMVKNCDVCHGISSRILWKCLTVAGRCVVPVRGEPLWFPCRRESPKPGQEHRPPAGCPASQGADSAESSPPSEVKNVC